MTKEQLGLFKEVVGLLSDYVTAAGDDKDDRWTVEAAKKMIREEEK